MHNFNVAKFGGTSVMDPTSMQRCAAIVAKREQIRLVVVSAPAGITNQLVQLCQGAPVLDSILSRLEAFFKALTEPEAIKTTFENYKQSLQHLAERFTHENSPLLRDELLSLGERCSSLFFTAILQKQNINAINFDARSVIKTDSNFGKAEPDIAAIAQHCQEQLLALCQESVVITQGFIGSDPDDRTTTLGRGGSDYSAALLAEGLGVQCLEIWTDVDGIYTTDPRIVPQAKPIEHLSFDEAAELATFGAKVLHPATLWPAMRKNIKVFVGSSRNLDFKGTWIYKKTDDEPAVRALALRKKQTLLTIHSLKMFHARGFLAQVFAILASHNIGVDIVTTSEVSVSLTLDNTSAGSTASSLLTPEVLNELEAIEQSHLEIEEGLSLVALVGNGLHSMAGISGKVFSTLEQYNIRLICYGASSHNLCFLVKEDLADDILRTLHSAFFDNKGI